MQTNNGEKAARGRLSHLPLPLLPAKCRNKRGKFRVAFSGVSGRIWLGYRQRNRFLSWGGSPHPAIPGPTGFFIPDGAGLCHSKRSRLLSVQAKAHCVMPDPVPSCHSERGHALSFQSKTRLVIPSEAEESACGRKRFTVLGARRSTRGRCRGEAARIRPVHALARATGVRFCSRPDPSAPLGVTRGA